MVTARLYLSVFKLFVLPSNYSNFFLYSLCTLYPPLSFSLNPDDRKAKNIHIAASMTVSASAPATKSRVLIAGATGFIGQFVASASLDSGRQTYVLVRPGLAGCLSKSKVLKSLHDKGAIILHVCIIRLI